MGTYVLTVVMVRPVSFGQDFGEVGAVPHGEAHEWLPDEHTEFTEEFVTAPLLIWTQVDLPSAGLERAHVQVVGRPRPRAQLQPRES
jgi:hypothetical protein